MQAETSADPAVSSVKTARFDSLANSFLRLHLSTLPPRRTKRAVVAEPAKDSGRRQSFSVFSPS